MSPARDGIAHECTTTATVVHNAHNLANPAVRAARRALLRGHARSPRSTPAAPGQCSRASALSRRTREGGARYRGSHSGCGGYMPQRPFREEWRTLGADARSPPRPIDSRRARECGESLASVIAPSTPACVPGVLNRDAGSAVTIVNASTSAHAYQRAQSCAGTARYAFHSDVGAFPN